MNTNSVIPTQNLLIVPCYNEEARLTPSAFVNFAEVNTNIHFLFVDDGSTDNTAKILEHMASKVVNINSLILNQNVGKGAAIRAGVLHITEQQKGYTYVGYLDADLSVPLIEMKFLVDKINENSDIKFLLGIRVSRMGVNIKRKASRHYLGRIFATVVSLIIKESIYDTQCGAKLIEYSLAKELFKEAFVSSWFFDVELVIRSKIKFPDYSNFILEYPLNTWIHIPESKLKVSDFLSVPIELFRIWNVYRKSLKSSSYK